MEGTGAAVFDRAAEMATLVDIIFFVPVAAFPRANISADGARFAGDATLVATAAS